MIRSNRLFGAAVLSIGLAATGSAHSQTTSATPAKTKTRHKSQEQATQERLDKLESLTEKYDRLEHEVQDIKSQLAASNAALAASRTEAAAQAARVQQLQAAEAASAPQAEALATLQSSVADLNSKSSSLALAVETEQKKTQALEMPEKIHFKGHM